MTKIRSRVLLCAFGTAHTRQQTTNHLLGGRNIQEASVRIANSAPIFKGDNGKEIVNAAHGGLCKQAGIDALFFQLG